MKDNEKLIKNLNQIFKSKKFIKSLMQSEEKFSEYIYYKMGKVLEYYIVTRDESLNYTYEEIEEKLNQIDYEALKENIIDKGFMTHSFNGNKKSIVEKYGLDYISKMDEKELKQRKEMRTSLNELEKILGTSQYVVSLNREVVNNYDKNVFICTPGAKTFYYACKRSPERLYEGPLKDYQKEPIIVGETRDNYFMRVLEKKINEKYPQKDSKERENAIKVAKKVVESYCSFSPAFAMLNLSEIKDIQAGVQEYRNGNIESLMERIIRETRDCSKFFSWIPSDSAESNNLGDLAVLGTEIPQKAISIVECMDEFELQQIFAKVKGLKVGEYIDYTPDKVKGKPKISELSTVIDNTDNIEELNDTYNVYKNEILEQQKEKMKKIENKYGAISIEDLKEDLERKKDKLLEKRRDILERDYPKKAGISLDYTLKEALEEIEKNNLKEYLLETDKNIKEDDLQYSSDIHGVSHTRRANLLANLIMNKEKVDESTRKVIETIIRNHDIGRTNDIEDKEHGKKSVDLLEKNMDRLETLSDKQKEVVKFTIKEHSLSARENEDDLNSMFETKIQKDFEEEMLQIPSWMVEETIEQNVRNRVSERYKKEKMYVKKVLGICKDADKLDRVRLDPFGQDEREGLNINRLSMESSKSLENIAYEALNKGLEILDIEHELVDIDREMTEIDELTTLNDEVKQFTGFEEKMNEAKISKDMKKEKALRDIVSERRLSKISEIPKKIKNLFLRKEQKKER